MEYKKLHRIFGAIVFVIAAMTYFITVQPSVSFWDCGEFIASAYGMQVPHPPGTPFFLILGRVFSMIPFADNIALRVNMVSVISSAFVILFLYLIAVKLIENYKQKKYDSMLDAFGTYMAAAIGALSLTFADTFWFNAVEAEVYALSAFFIAFVTWLMLLWNERADEEDNEKYLIFIAYLLGLSTGVHLMSVLAMVPIVMTIMFRKYITDDETLKKTGILLLVHAGIVLLIALGIWASETGTQAPFPEEFKEFDQRFVMIVGIASIIFMAALWKKIFQKNSFYMPIIIGGIALVAVYPGFVKYVPKLVSLIGGNNTTLALIVIGGLIGLIGYGTYWSRKNNKLTLNLVFKCFLFAFLGYSSSVMIIIRSNQDTPINLNSPKTMTEFLSYVNREQYGDFPTFKRRFSQEPHQQDIYTQYTSDLDFFLRYQMNHMFNRYLLWNYAGRVSTNQDAGVDFTDLFGIPFLIGILGLYYHFKRDWKMASIFLMMFIFLGYLTAFYQNQQEPQPRERDYFYVGAFFVYSIWIALGVRGILDIISESFKESKLLKPAFYGSGAVLFLAVPVLMLNANFHEHDRSGNYMPWDYSYNMLQSVAPNAVLFTNGDNDTFPLWYLQEVEGVRQDVRIANLSLLNTPWYILQLKNQSPHGSMKVEMNLTDKQIEDIGPMQWEPRTMKIEVPDEIIEEYGITDTSIVNNNYLTWKMNNTAQIGRYKAVRVQDLIVLDIIQASKWKRPVYFAVTCSDNSRIGLDPYLQMEGLAFRVVPQKRERTYSFVNEEVLRKQLLDEPEGFSKTYQPGFKFRGMGDQDIYFDEQADRLVQNYRNSYLRLAIHYLETKREKEAAIEVLNAMETKLPRTKVPLRYEILNDVAYLYFRAGDMETYKRMAAELEEQMLAMIERNPRDVYREYSPYLVLRDIYENLGEYDKLIELFTRLKTYIPNDPTIDQIINQYKQKVRSDSIEVGKKELDIE